MDLTVHPKWLPFFYTTLAIFGANLTSIYVQFSILGTYILPKSRKLLKKGLVSRRPVSTMAKVVKSGTAWTLFIL